MQGSDDYVVITDLALSKRTEQWNSEGTLHRSLRYRVGAGQKQANKEEKEKKSVVGRKTEGYCKHYGFAVIRFRLYTVISLLFTVLLFALFCTSTQSFEEPVFA